MMPPVTEAVTQAAIALAQPEALKVVVLAVQTAAAVGASIQAVSIPALSKMTGMTAALGAAITVVVLGDLL